MYGFALRPRWLAAHAAIAAIGAACVIAGLWQLSRHESRRAFIELVSERRERPEASVDAAALHQAVRVDGEYDPEREVIVRARSISSGPGHHVLTPLRLADGTAILVDRGWVPFDASEPPVDVARPPPGRVTVRGWLLPSERRRPLAPSDPETGTLDSVSRIDTQRVGAQLPYEVRGGEYVHLVSQEPGGPGDLPLVEQLPTPGAGRHLGYAVQWFLFVPVGLGGWAAIVHREGRKRASKVSAP